MSKLVVCRLCAGQRKIPGMGFMSMNCPECDGKGYVKNDHYVCDLCQKEITLAAAAKVVEAQAVAVETKRPRARKVSRDVISIDDMSLSTHDDAALY